MKTVHFVQKKMEMIFVSRTLQALLALPIILNHIKFISFSVNHGNLVQHHVS